MTSITNPSMPASIQLTLGLFGVRNRFEGSGACLSSAGLAGEGPGVGLLPELPVIVTC